VYIDLHSTRLGSSSSLAFLHLFLPKKQNKWI
jgi:hypothetical protein